MLDFDFFEKCFFGKKLQSKEKSIFKVYAKELFDMIGTTTKYLK